MKKCMITMIIFLSIVTQNFTAEYNSEPEVKEEDVQKLITASIYRYTTNKNLKNLLTKCGGYATSPNHGMTALHFVVVRPYESAGQIVRTVKHIIDFYDKGLPLAQNGKSPLHLACERGLIACVDIFLKHDKKSILLMETPANQPLDHIIRAEKTLKTKIDICKKILDVAKEQQETLTNIINDDDANIPLLQAIFALKKCQEKDTEEEKIKFIELILEATPSDVISYQNNDLDTPLHALTNAGCVEKTLNIKSTETLIKKILEKNPETRTQNKGRKFPVDDVYAYDPSNLDEASSKGSILGMIEYHTKTLAAIFYSK